MVLGTGSPGAAPFCGRNAWLQTAGQARVPPAPWTRFEDCIGERVLRPLCLQPRSLACQRYVTHRLSERLGFLPGFGLNRDSVTPSRPAPVRLRSRRGSRGVATLISLPSVNPAAEQNVNHHLINDHGNSRGFDAAMHPEIGEVTA